MVLNPLDVQLLSWSVSTGQAVTEAAIHIYEVCQQSSTEYRGIHMKKIRTHQPPSTMTVGSSPTPWLRRYRLLSKAHFSCTTPDSSLSNGYCLLPIHPSIVEIAKNSIMPVRPTLIPVSDGGSDPVPLTTLGRMTRYMTNTKSIETIIEIMAILGCCQTFLALTTGLNEPISMLWWYPIRPEIHFYTRGLTVEISLRILGFDCWNQSTVRSTVFTGSRHKRL